MKRKTSSQNFCRKGMKLNKFMPIMAGLIILTGAGVSNIAMAQASRDTLVNSIDKIPMNGEIIDHESDPKVEERNLKHEFRGINLTSKRFDQIKQARRQFRKGLKQVMSSGLGSILQLVLLPQKEAEDKARNLFRNPIAGYGEALSKILTPEEIKIWQRNVEQGAKRN